MYGGIFSIIFGLLLLVSFTTFDSVYGQIAIKTTPDDIIFKNHGLKIDIENGNPQVQLEIQVSTSLSNDSETFFVDFDTHNLWQKHRIVLYPIFCSTCTDIQGNGIVEAQNNDTITIQEVTTGTKQTLIFHSSHSPDISSGSPQTILTVLTCPDVGQTGPQDDDIDSDGVCDAWEVNNSLHIDDASLGIYDFDCMDITIGGFGSCGNDKPDIFVELDWLESHKPDPKALMMIRDAFDQQGIRVHFQVDTEMVFKDSTTNLGHLAKLPWPGEDPSAIPPIPKGFDELRGDSFGTTTERSTYSSTWVTNEKILKHQIFHYAILGHSDFDGTTSTGKGEIWGNDFVVTLGKYPGATGSEEQQAGTIMHELGHNLNLDHGGHDDINNKPNLFSVMTYVRQFTDFDGNRDLDYSNQELGHHHSNIPPMEINNVELWRLDEKLIKGWNKGLWPYDNPEHHLTDVIIFSCPDNAPNPYSADWLTGAQGGVDWDCDTFPKTKGEWPLNVNNFDSWPTPPDEMLEGHCDWCSLNYKFQEHGDHYANGRDGVNTNLTEDEITLEGTTLNKISVLLSLYRQIELFDDDDFTHGFLSNSAPTTANTISIPAGTGAPGCDSTNECYIPATITIPVATELTWSNDDTAAHTVTSGSDADGPSGIFDSSLILAGETFSHTFDSVGNYPYWCMVHPWMDGMVIVSNNPGSSGQTPPGDSKDSFKSAIRNAIKFVNINNIYEAKNTVQLIDFELKTSLVSHNYDLVEPITSNLVLTYEKHLGFGYVPPGEEILPPIVASTKIDNMIEKVEKFVTTIKTPTLRCGIPFEIDHNQCVCPAGLVENSEGDCLLKPYWPPSKQWDNGVSVENIKCQNVGNEVIMSTSGKPVCVNPSSVQPLLDRGYANTVE